MLDSPATRQLIEQQSKELRDALGDQFRWRWDEHYKALLAEFSVDHANHVQCTLRQHFPHCWDRKSIKKAPQQLKARCDCFAQLSQSQLLYGTDDTDTQEVMVAWWPWGHGATVSVRMFRLLPVSELPEASYWQRIMGIFAKN